MLLKCSLILILLVNLRSIESKCSVNMVKNFVYPEARRDDSVVDDYPGSKVKSNHLCWPVKDRQLRCNSDITFQILNRLPIHTVGSKILIRRKLRNSSTLKTKWRSHFWKTAINGRKSTRNWQPFGIIPNTMCLIVMATTISPIRIPVCKIKSEYATCLLISEYRFLMCYLWPLLIIAFCTNKLRWMLSRPYS